MLQTASNENPLHLHLTSTVAYIVPHTTMPNEHRTSETPQRLVVWIICSTLKGDMFVEYNKLHCSPAFFFTSCRSSIFVFIFIFIRYVHNLTPFSRTESLLNLKKGIPKPRLK